MKGIQCALIGRVGTDPKLGTTRKGKPWFRTSVAVDDWKDGEEPQWCQVAYFGDKADELGERVKPGVECYVEGTIRLNEWTTQAGEHRAGLSVASFKLEPLGQIGRKRPKRQDDQDDDGNSSKPKTSSTPPTDDEPPPPNDKHAPRFDDDDIPF